MVLLLLTTESLKVDIMCIREGEMIVDDGDRQTKPVFFLFPLS